MSEIGKAQRAEDAKVIVGWVVAVEKEVCGEMVDGRGGSPVDEMVGSVEGLNPIFGWHVCVNEKSAEHVVGGA